MLNQRRGPEATSRDVKPRLEKGKEPEGWKQLRVGGVDR